MGCRIFGPIMWYLGLRGRALGWLAGFIYAKLSSLGQQNHNKLTRNLESIVSYAVVNRGWFQDIIPGVKNSFGRRFLLSQSY